MANPLAVEEAKAWAHFDKFDKTPIVGAGSTAKTIQDDVVRVIIDSIGDTITIEQAIGLLASKCRIKLIGGAWFALSDGQTFTYELSFERF